MIKALLMTATTLLTSMAFAWPAVGDTATYSAVPSVGPASEMKITIKEKNDAENFVKFELATTVNNETTTSEENAPLSDLTQLASSVPFILGSCSMLGGTPESIEVAAGKFDACKLTTSDTEKSTTVWMANVVFGWVRQLQTTTATGETLDVTLKAFTAGQ